MQTPQHAEDQANRRLRHGPGVGATVVRHGDVERFVIVDVDAVVAGTEELDVPDLG